MRSVRTALCLALLLSAGAAAAIAAPATTAAPPTPAAPPATPAAPEAPDVTAPAVPPADDVIRQKIVGSWGQSATCAEGRLTFNADGSFLSKGAGEPDGVTGTYVIDHGRLTGENGDNDMPTMLVNFDGDKLLLDDGSGSPQRLDRCQAPQ